MPLTFDPRTEKNLATLTPKAQEAARALLEAQNKALAGSSLVARITFGYRTDAEQDALYAQGRTQPGKIVTNAKGGESWHCYRVAWDLTIFRTSAGKTWKKGDPTYETKWYDLAADVALSFPGISRGIDFPTPDRPHYQLALGYSVAQAQAMRAKGQAVG